MPPQIEPESYAAIVVSRNNLDLLKGAVRSVLDQDVPTSVLVYDNGSDDGTLHWLSYASRQDRRISMAASRPQHSVSSAWNWSLRFLFGFYDRVLVINQDVVLRPDTVRWLAAENADFVTGVGSADPKSIEPLPPLKPMPLVDNLARSTGIYRIMQAVAPAEVEYVERPFREPWYPRPSADATRPHPDFSCFMISRACYERVGPFDENFLGAYCEDSDYHVRMHRAGIHAYCIDLPFWHVGGGAQTVKRADSMEQQRINEQAEMNREYFKSKWGFAVGSHEYYAYFGHGAPDTAGEKVPC